MLANFLRKGVGRAMATLPEASVPFAKVMTAKSALESTEELIDQGQKIIDKIHMSPDRNISKQQAILMFIRAFTIAKTRDEQIYALGALGSVALTCNKNPVIQKALKEAGIHENWYEPDIIDWPKNPDGTDGRMILDYGPPIPPPKRSPSGSGPQLR